MATAAWIMNKLSALCTALIQTQGTQSFSRIEIYAKLFKRIYLRTRWSIFYYRQTHTILCPLKNISIVDYASFGMVSMIHYM